MALINLKRASELITNFNTDDSVILQNMINAASGFVERYCNRTFAVTTYDELVDGTGHQSILLENYPIVSLERVTFNQTQVVSVQNSKASVSRASYRLDATNLYLTAVDNGNLITRTITRSTCTTLQDLSDAINSYASDGWVSTPLGMYSTWRTADLFPQGGNEIRWLGNAYLWLHTFGVPAILTNPKIGEVVSVYGFTRGYQNYRVQYSAGFANTPEEIEQVVAELAIGMYKSRNSNPNLTSETLGDYSYTNLTNKSLESLSISSRYALNMYKNHRIAKTRIF